VKRLAHHLFTLFAAVSLLLCIAVCVLWVRSYSMYTFDSYASNLPGKGHVVHWEFNVTLDRGTISLGRRLARNPLFDDPVEPG
jgi:hypothetical protein